MARWMHRGVDSWLGDSVTSCKKKPLYGVLDLKITIIPYKECGGLGNSC